MWRSCIDHFPSHSPAQMSVIRQTWVDRHPVWTACQFSNGIQLLSHHKLYSLNHFKYSPVELGEIEWTKKGDFNFANFRINYNFQNFTLGNYFIVKKPRKKSNFNININLQLLCFFFFFLLAKAWSRQCPWYWINAPDLGDKLPSETWLHLHEEISKTFFFNSNQCSR